MSSQNVDRQIADFEQFYIEHKDRIYTYLLNILNYNKDDAYQILSESFVKLWEYIQKNKVEKMKGLLYSIAHNLAINLIKKNSRIVSFEENKIYYDDVLENANFNFEQQEIQSVIFEMDDITKEVFHLTYYEEKSYEEIGEILKIPKNTIGTILFKMKKRLKQKYLSVN